MRRADRRLAQRATPLALVLVACATVTVDCSPSRSASVSRGFEVTVLIDGHPKTGHLDRPKPVAALLWKLRVAPHSGRLLSRVSRRVLSADLHPAVITVGDRPASLLTRITRPVEVRVNDGTDEMEPTISRLALTGPNPPAIEVMRVLATAGHPTAELVAKGAFSGETVTVQPAAALTAPAPRVDKVVALTFDDGPGNYTAQILRTLRDKGVTATFCLIGRQAQQSPDLVKQIVADGHQLCNHTQDHDIYLDRKTNSVIDAQITSGFNAITVASGGHQPRFYRPPGGALSPAIINTANADGLQVLMWTVDPEDWRRPGTDKIITKATTAVPNGGIILLHDGGGDRSQTVAALPVIIDRLRAQGFTIVHPDTTLAKPPPNP